MQNPNLFIVGAPKAGTSFLFKKLQNHPALFFPRIKELNHFSHDELYDLGSYYKDFKVKNRGKYLDFYSKSKGQTYLADCSVSYFTFPEVAKKIRTFNPDAKIVIILRDPIKRAYSHYMMDVRMGYASLPMATYISDQNRFPAHYHQYIKNSLYWKNISHYRKIFGSKNVCVLVLENIEKDIEKLFYFLEISDLKTLDTTEKVNQNKTPKNFISKTLQKNRKIASQLKMLIPPSIVERFNGLLYEGKETKPMNIEVEKILKQTLYKDIKLLNDHLEVDLNHLWKI